MAHIPDGVLTAPVLAAGAIMAAGGVAMGLRLMDYERIPRVAVMASAFFVASLVQIPVGPSSVHLLLGGLLGVILGWAAFPPILVGLLLQAVLFGFGGVIALGVNTVNIALPAVAVHYLSGRPLRRAGRGATFAWGAGAGAGAVLMTAGLVCLSLVGSGREFLPVIKLVLAAHLPLMLVEGFITGAAAVLLRLVRPELLHAPLRHTRLAP